ncbi:MAG: hypothetical protein NZ571_11485 [Anaerolineae bacterium]|nr:hypothetical protein [Anaerolineae bacterium]
MRRWLIVCVLLSAALASSVALARVLGSRQTPRFHVWLRHANGMPCERACILGVAPSSALSFEAAQAILAEHPLVDNAMLINRGLTVHWRTESFVLSIGRTQDSEQLAWINLQLRQRDLQVRDLVAAYGIPDYVAAANNTILTDLLYAAHGLQASALREALPEGAPLRLSHRVYNLYLVKDEQFQALLRQIGGNLKAWRGFVSVARYLNRPSRFAVP